MLLDPLNRRVQSTVYANGPLSADQVSMVWSSSLPSAGYVVYHLLITWSTFCWLPGVLFVGPVIRVPIVMCGRLLTLIYADQSLIVESHDCQLAAWRAQHYVIGLY